MIVINGKEDKRNFELLIMFYFFTALFSHGSFCEFIG